MATVFTNGCFDILHSGHYQLLLYCRHIAGKDPVYVGIDSDSRVAKSKGVHRPYYNQQERKDLLMSLTLDGKINSKGYGNYIIDWVDSFETDDELYSLIKFYEPDYIVKGSDWQGKKLIGDDLATPHFAPTYYKDFFSTSKIEERILLHNQMKFQ